MLKTMFPTLAARQGAHQLVQAADAHGIVAQGAQGRIDGVHGLRAVELGHGLVAVAARLPVVLEVEGQAETHSLVSSCAVALPVSSTGSWIEHSRPS